MSSKTNKAAAIREYQALDPKATPKEVAAAIGCDVTYVYLVNNKERKKQAKPKVTRGQEVLRQELTQHDKLIAEKDKTIAGMEKLLQEASHHNHILQNEVGRLNIIIQWLEGRLRGTSV
jgi:hypothetical protein